MDLAYAIGCTPQQAQRASLHLADTCSPSNAYLSPAGRPSSFDCVPDHRAAGYNVPLERRLYHRGNVWLEWRL
jgi:hypothetical protein